MSLIADITKIDAPPSAIAGATVLVDVSVKNIAASDKYISVTAAFNSTLIPFQFDYLLVSPGQTVIMRGNFTMPSKSVKVTAWSWYWDGSKWSTSPDDTVTKDISLSAFVPEFSELAILSLK